MEIEMEQRGKSKTLACKQCGAKNMTPLGSEAIQGSGAKFISLDAICENGHKSHFQWTNQVTLRTKNVAEDNDQSRGE